MIIVSHIRIGKLIAQEWYKVLIVQIYFEIPTYHCQKRGFEFFRQNLN